MRAFVVVLASAAAAASGCGGQPELKPADASLGRAALLRGLEAWQAGLNSEELKQGKPPVQFNDADWRAGWRLVRFELAAGHDEVAVHVRFRAKLTLEGPDGKPKERAIVYRVQTGEIVTVKRADW